MFILLWNNSKDSWKLSNANRLKVRNEIIEVMTINYFTEWAFKMPWNMFDCMHLIDKNFQEKTSLASSSSGFWHHRVNSREFKTRLISQSMFPSVFYFSRIFIQFRKKLAIWMENDWTNYEKKELQKKRTNIESMLSTSQRNSINDNWCICAWLCVTFYDTCGSKIIAQSKWIVSFRTEEVPLRVIKILLPQIV